MDTSITLLGDGRYKPIALLESRADLELYRALDIESSRRDEALITLYKSQELIRLMAGVYVGMTRAMYPSFLGCFVQGQYLAAAFSYEHGADFNTFFSKHSALTREDRLIYARTLMDSAIQCAPLPALLLQSSFRPENIAVQQSALRVCINPCADPSKADGVPSKLLGALINTVLMRPWYANDEQIDFLLAVADNEYSTLSEVYSLWRETEKTIQADIESDLGLVAKLVRCIKRSARLASKKARLKRQARKAAKKAV